jgi:hypothetical protein
VVLKKYSKSLFPILLGPESLVFAKIVLILFLNLSDDRE